MDFKKQTLILFIFLLTSFFNKSLADTIPLNEDTIQNQDIFFFDKIEKNSRDSIKLSVDGKKVFLYGNAEIKYQSTTITASYIEINWN